MKSAMEKLSANQRQVIELAYFEGLSQTEMAERMGQPLGNGEDLGAHGAEKSARRTRSGGAGMNCEELRDHYELYAMGVADEPERSEIREHLSRGCEVCMSEMKRARELTALLGVGAAPAAPSPKLRRRILASVGFEQRALRLGAVPRPRHRALALRRVLLLRARAPVRRTGRRPARADAPADHRAHPPQRSLRDPQRARHHEVALRRRQPARARSTSIRSAACC